jgi:hypothetical protein
MGLPLAWMSSKVREASPHASMCAMSSNLKDFSVAPPTIDARTSSKVDRGDKKMKPQAISAFPDVSFLRKTGIC